MLCSKQGKMLFLLFSAIGVVNSLPIAPSNSTLQIACQNETFNLRLFQSGNWSCTLKKNHAPTDNKSMTLNFKKIRDACGNDSSSPKAIARSDVLSNQTTIIDVIFRNVSWQTAGDYVITLNFGHTTRERHFTVNVYDNPLLPENSKIMYKGYKYWGSELFAFYAPLPEVNNCTKDTGMSYRASYRAQDCSLSKERGIFSCNVNHHNNLFCWSESLFVCQNRHLEFCRLQINLIAENNVGNSTTMNFTSDFISNAVNLPIVDLEVLHSSSTTLKVSWIKPCNVYDYSYIIVYAALDNSTLQQKTYYPITDRTTVAYTIANLRPATGYRVCIKANHLDNFILSKDRCITKKTKEDVPSRPPKNLMVRIIKTDEENIRRRVFFSWKLPDRQYWNGKIYVMVEFIETRKPNLIQIPKRVHPSKDNVILTDLFKDRDYSLRVALCTQRGCRNSAWEFVPKQAVPVPSKWWIYLIVIASVILLIGFIAFCIHKYKSKNYNELKEDIPAVRPRLPVQAYEESSEGPNRYEQYPSNDEPKKDADIEIVESDREEKLFGGQLEFHNDNAEGLEQLEMGVKNEC